MEKTPKKTTKELTAKSRFFRSALVLVLSLIIAFGGLYIVISSLFNSFLSPIDANDATPIEFVIEDGWGASTIAKHLYEACGEGEPGLISNKAVFKIYVDFIGKSKELRAGKYYLSKNMDIPTIIDALCKGGENTQTVRVTIPEGTTVENVAKLLKDAGMMLDTTEFLNLCKKGETFTSYAFVNNVVIADEDRRYALEGYLFPDTYEFYVDASSETVLIKMLDRFEDVCYNEENSYEKRAKELGMSMDEVISLAALIEKEAVLDDDFYKVSAVFHNRLADDMKLQSDAAIAYILGIENRLSLTAEEMEVDSPYNTHKYKGVPLGAICNPGKTAIEAALHPYEEFMPPNEKYLYFCLKDKETGELVYAKTLEEHNANVAKYSGGW